MGCMSSRSTVTPSDVLPKKMSSKKSTSVTSVAASGNPSGSTYNAMNKTRDSFSNDSGKEKSSINEKTKSLMSKKSYKHSLSEDQDDERDSDKRRIMSAVQVSSQKQQNVDKSFSSNEGDSNSTARERKKSASLEKDASVFDDIMSELEPTNTEPNRQSSSSSQHASNQSEGDNMSVQTNANRNVNINMRDVDKAPKTELVAQQSNDLELDTELLEHYITVDHEITLLEEMDSLNFYHEKIQQIESIEREIEMINADMERGNSFLQDGITKATEEIESSTEASSSGTTKNKENSTTAKQVIDEDGYKSSPSKMSLNVDDIARRRTILIQRREKLKKEIEIVIAECDRLQANYKLRDIILDHLYDGEAGNGLENHLEQQLNWLLEQKHYVDQVFYAWKRAETLTGQSCEQFALALSQLKQLPKVNDVEKKQQLAKSIKELLITSRRDMEHAQRYNPNVDPPFFTESETLRFDEIISTLDLIKAGANWGDHGGGAIGQFSESDYNQLLSITAFAYKRSMSIHLWLEQILQTTIARDSFELAEEYKWIAIQLRKERINLVKLALQDSSKKRLVQDVRERLARQKPRARQQQLRNVQYSMIEREKSQHSLLAQSGNIARVTSDVPQVVATTTNIISNQVPSLASAHKGSLASASMINGFGSSFSGQANAFKFTDMSNGQADIEDEVHQLLELSRPRLEETRVQQLRLNQSANSEQDSEMRARILRRVEGSSRSNSVTDVEMADTLARAKQLSTNGTGASSTVKSMSNSPTLLTSKLKIELDEETKKNLQSKCPC